MGEYEKLTVVKLREELVKRGLPKTGLKAALVQRLVESDEHSASVEGPGEPKESHVPSENVEVVGENAPIGTAQVDGGSDERPHSTSDLQGEVPGEVPFKRQEEVTGSQTPVETQNTEPVNGSFTTERQNTDSGSHVTDNSMTGTTDSVNTYLEGSMPMEHTTNISTQTSVSVIEESVPVEHASDLLTQSSVNPEEILEDTRKRKRRSESPPLSTQSIQKRARISDETRPAVKLPEDESMEETPSRGNETPTQQSVTRESQIEPPKEALVNGVSHAEQGDDRPEPMEDDSPVEEARSSRPKVQEDEDRIARDGKEATPPPQAVGGPTKTSPTDARFKNLMPLSKPLEPRFVLIFSV